MHAAGVWVPQVTLHFYGGNAFHMLGDQGVVGRIGGLNFKGQSNCPGRNTGGGFPHKAIGLPGGLLASLQGPNLEMQAFT